MLDFMFFVKTLALTFLIVIAMQSKWGEATVEEHTFDFIHSSALMVPLKRTASSGVHVVRTSMAWLSKQVNQKIHGRNIGENEAGLSGRASGFKLKRSEESDRSRSADTTKGDSASDDE